MNFSDFSVGTFDAIATELSLNLLKHGMRPLAAMPCPSTPISDPGKFPRIADSIRADKFSIS